MDKVQPRVEKMLCTLKDQQERFLKFKINAQVDDLLSAIKDSSLFTAVAAMKCTLSHLADDKQHMLAAFKFAFRLHQFSVTGLSGESCDLFRKIHSELQDSKS